MKIASQLSEQEMPEMADSVITDVSQPLIKDDVRS